MTPLRRLVLVRHGETQGNSGVRFHGSSDVPLSDAGRAQMGEVAALLRREPFDLVVASPLRRSWEAAQIVGGGAPVRLEADFREVDFGRWEGLTREEIEASDPILYRDWQGRAPGFEYPGGERREDFAARVKRGLAALQHSGARNALLVIHKGVIRTLGEALLGGPLGAAELPLGAVVWLTREAPETWFEGRRGSNPAALDHSSDSRSLARTL